MRGDSRRPFYGGRNKYSPYMGIDGAHVIMCDPAEYANTESIWVNKVNLNTFTHVSAFLMKISSKGRTLLGEKHQSCYQWQQTFQKKRVEMNAQKKERGKLVIKVTFLLFLSYTNMYYL